MRIAFFTAVASVAIAGCAASSGIIDTGNGTFYSSKQSANSFGGAGNLKADVIKEAAAFCAKRGQTVRVTNTTEAQPPYILGNYPRVEIEFKCAGTDQG
jgi:hypothetical protein